MLLPATASDVRHLCEIADKGVSLYAMQYSQDVGYENLELPEIIGFDVRLIYMRDNYHASIVKVFENDRQHNGQNQDIKLAQKLCVFWVRLLREPLAREAIRLVGSFPIPPP